jgi:hypothetical protein
VVKHSRKLLAVYTAAKRWGEARERERLVRPWPVFLEQEAEQRAAPVSKIASVTLSP